MVLDTAGKIWLKFQELCSRIKDLEGDSEDTKKEIGYLQKELELLRKNAGYNEKIQTHHGAKIAELETRIRKLESEKHGAKISAGIAKSKLAKLQDAAKQ
jgi:predicted RNase H-like nuclease (RuvC/YqgF family)